jgi:hypothetical protein
MYYAPEISNADIGGGTPGGTYPAVILHGHHGYAMQPLGQAETAAINKDYDEMLARIASSKKCGACRKTNLNKAAADFSEGLID